jgi:hypothetical protein
MDFWFTKEHALYANKINELLQNASLRQEFVGRQRKAIANLVLQLKETKYGFYKTSINFDFYLSY